MNIEQLNLFNFFSYKEDVIKFKQNNIFFIYGKDVQTGKANGVGKSIIKEAIRFLLYGKCRISSKKDIIRFGESQAKLFGKFKIDNKSYSIEREIYKNKPATLKLFQDKVNLSCSKLKDTQDLIDELLGVNYEQFMYSFCFGQSEFDDLKNLTTTKLIDFLKSVLKLDVFNNYLDESRDILKDLDNRINKMLGIKEAYTKLINTQISEEQVKDNINKINSEIDNILKKISTKEEDCNEVSDKHSELKSIYRENKSFLNTVIESLDFIKDNNKCPTCKTKLKESTLENKLKENKNSYENVLNNLKPKLEELDNKLTSIKNKQYSLEEILDNKKEIKYRLESKLEDYLENKNIKFNEDNYKKLVKQRAIVRKGVDVFDSKGLPLYILNYYIPILEHLINKELEEICDFKIELVTSKKLKSSDRVVNTCEFSIRKGGKKYSLENLSNGQEFLVTLGIRLAISKLYQNKKKFETLILDEGFGRLCNLNKQIVLKAISNLKDKFKKIIIISHDQEIINWTEPQKIFIKMNRGISSIIQE